MSRSRKLLVLGTVATMVFWCTATRAVDYSWQGGSGTLWTTAANWTGGSGTDHPDDINDTATSNNGSAPVTVDLDASKTVGRFSVGYVAGTTAQTGNVVLDGSGTTLIVGDATTGGLLHVGSGVNVTAYGATTGTLSLEPGTALSLVGGAFYLGTREDSLNPSSTQGENSTGILNMASGSELQVGTADDRSEWIIGEQRLNRNFRSATGTFSASGGDLTAYLTNLTVGRNVRGGGETSQNKGVGTLDLAGLDSALIDTHELWVGTTNVGHAEGIMTIGNNHSVRVGTDTVAGELLIGISYANNPQAMSGTNPLDGTLNMGPGSSLTVGTAAQGAEMTIGWNLGVRGTTVDREGDLVATGGTFAGHLSSLTVGSQDAPFQSGRTFIADGTLDLRQATITAFDVSGNVAIGHSTVSNAQNSRGAVYLSQVAGSIGGTLAVGDTDAGSSGLLELHGTHLDVVGDVNIYESGKIDVLVPDVAAGLSMAGGFGIADGGLYAITFEEDPSAGYFVGSPTHYDAIHYGLKWSGNHTSDLTDLGSKLTWDDTTYLSTAFIGAANIFYDAGTNATYVGFYVVPEPSAVLLLFGALASLALARRRK